MGLARCALNPETMQSKKYYIEPAKKQKKIAIIGGGIGGMEAAIVCAKRGHTVTLYEKSDKLGGVFIAASTPSFKEKDRELIAWYIRELSRYKINIKMNTEIKDVKSLDADEIIVATGAVAKNIPVKGSEKAIEAIDYLLENKTVGENVVVIGGGLTGCEIAYDLYLKGKKPVIVEMQDDLITTKGVCLANTSYLRDFFKTNKVPVHLETSLSEIKNGSVTLKDKEGKSFTVKADSVVLSVGYNSAPLVSKGRHIHVIGDADKVGNLRTVIWGAWNTCMKL
jgi:2-enoate reductase